MNARIYVSVSKQRPELVSPRLAFFPKEIARNIAWDPVKGFELQDNPYSDADRMQDAVLSEQFDYAFRLSENEHLVPAGSVSMLDPGAGIAYGARAIVEAIKQHQVEEYELIDPLQDLGAMTTWSRTSLFRGRRAQNIIRDQIQLYGQDARYLLYRRSLNGEEKSLLESKIAELDKD